MMVFNHVTDSFNRNIHCLFSVDATIKQTNQIKSPAYKFEAKMLTGFCVILTLTGLRLLNNINLCKAGASDGCNLGSFSKPVCVIQWKYKHFSILK